MAEFIYPLEKEGTISRGYGKYWNPTKNKYTNHYGVDFKIPSNTKVLSVADGTVVRSDMIDKDGYGNFIIIKHNLLGKDVYSAYAHLIKREVKVGDQIEAGDVIGLSGGDQGKENGQGFSTGPHLHFEIRKEIDGNFINPENYLSFVVMKDKSKDKIDDILPKIKDKANNIDIKKLKESFKDKLKNSKFREELANKLNITVEELDAKLEADGEDGLPEMVSAGIEILKDKAPLIWVAANKIWELVKTTLSTVSNSETAKFFKDKWREVEKEYEASDKRMWEQEQKIKKIVKKIL